MFCSKCGAPNSEGARFCEKCGNALMVAAAAAAAPGAGAAPAQSLPQPPPPPGYAPAAPGRTYAVGKSAGVAVLLSFLIPGVGQFYCGDSKKGGIMLAIYLVGWFTVVFVVGWIAVPVVWVWSMIDAYNIASGKTPLST